MFKTNLRLAYRSLMKEKGFTLINTIGLALGLACFILIMVYVIHEHSYEKFRPDYDRTYRIYLHGDFNSNSEQQNEGFLPYPMSAYIAAQYPEVEKVITLDQPGGQIVSYKDKSFQEWRILLADSNYFDMFPANFIIGASKNALQGSHKAVLTETSSKKWFGNENPLGKLMKVGNDTIPFEVTGVVKDPRTDTHVKYSMLLSDISFPAGLKETWAQSRNRYIYVTLKKGTSAQVFENKLQSILMEKIDPEYKTFRGKSIKEIVAGGEMPSFHLQKIEDIHLHSTLMMELGGVSGNGALVSISLIIAISIMLLACINFINLSTARFSQRMKEICVKKTVGSSRYSLFVQFMAESYLLTFIAIVIAVSMVELFIKPFCDIMQLEYVISFYNMPSFFPFIISVFILVGLLSGSYPALIMSRVTITDGLRSKNNTKQKGSFLRKGLVVVQFAISFIILLGAFVVNGQLQFIFADNKGYIRENLIVLHNFHDIKEGKEKVFKEEITKVPGVTNVSLANTYPTVYPGSSTMWKDDDSIKSSQTYIISGNDWDYLQTMKLTLIKGRYFYKEWSKDSLSIIINETAARILGYKNPIGKKLNTISGNKKAPIISFTIIGVVKDYNIQTIHNKILPTVNYARPKDFQECLVRLSGKNDQEAIKRISLLWKEFSNGNNLSYETMQDVINWQYRNEISANKMVITFSIICIIIASLGLIGLVSYSTLRRTKEIGIRKANGAEVWQILFTLSKDTIILIAIAIVIALPIAYFAINLWLKQFAYHVDITIGMILLSILGIYCIALLSEMVLTLKAARQNPVKALRYE